MLAALLLLQAAAQTAVDAEHAFNRSAQTEGQWKAFRAFSTPDATIFTPQPAKAHEVLPTKEPAIAVQWWPAESYVSCDGKLAVNTGPWVRPKAVGYFTTVWVRQPDGSWKWIMDGGDALVKPRVLPEKPKVRHASCAAGATSEPSNKARIDSNVKFDLGNAPDGSLRWFWTVDGVGARIFSAELWNGRKFETVIENKIAADNP